MVGKEINKAPQKTRLSIIKGEHQNEEGGERPIIEKEKAYAATIGRRRPHGLFVEKPETKKKELSHRRANAPHFFGGARAPKPVAGELVIKKKSAWACRPHSKGGPDTAMRSKRKIGGATATSIGAVGSEMGRKKKSVLRA